MGVDPLSEDTARRSCSVKTTTESAAENADRPSACHARLSNLLWSLEPAPAGPSASCSTITHRAKHPWSGKNRPVIRYSSCTTSGRHSRASRSRRSRRPGASRTAAHVGTPRRRARRTRIRFRNRDAIDLPRIGISTSSTRSHACRRRSSTRGSSSARVTSNASVCRVASRATSSATARLPPCLPSSRSGNGATTSTLSRFLGSGTPVGSGPTRPASATRGTGSRPGWSHGR
jgi:hypothetical protein